MGLGQLDLGARTPLGRVMFSYYVECLLRGKSICRIGDDLLLRLGTLHGSVRLVAFLRFMFQSLHYANLSLVSLHESHVKALGGLANLEHPIVVNNV